MILSVTELVSQSSEFTQRGENHIFTDTDVFPLKQTPYMFIVCPCYNPLCNLTGSFTPLLNHLLHMSSCHLLMLSATDDGL